MQGNLQISKCLCIIIRSCNKYNASKINASVTISESVELLFDAQSQFILPN